MISWSKCRPLKRSCAEVGSVIPGVTAVHRAFQAFAPEPFRAGSPWHGLAEVIDSYPRVHRTATIILGAFTFRSWKSADPVLTDLDGLHQLYASE
jgi:hypothetical protein